MKEFNIWARTRDADCVGHKLADEILLNRIRHMSTWLAEVLAVTVVAFAISFAGCEQAPWRRQQSSTNDPAPSTRFAPSAVGVLSIASPPAIAPHGRQMTHDEGALAGMLAGGGAGAGAGAATCAPSAIVGPLYGWCVATFGLLGATVGIFSGYAAVESFTTEPASWMLPDLKSLPEQFRAEVIRSLTSQLDGPPQDLGSIDRTLSEDYPPSEHASDEVASESLRKANETLSTTVDGGFSTRGVDMLLEIELTEIRAVTTRFGNYKIAIKADSHVRRLSDRSGDDNSESYYYRSPKIKGKDNRDTDAESIREAVDIGLRDLSEQLIAHHFGNN